MAAGAEKSSGRPLLLHHVVQIRGGGGGKVHRGQGVCGLNELDQLITVPFAPPGLVGPSERRAKSEGATKLVEVEHRDRRGSRRGNRSRGGKPRGCERNSGR
jgi:hypothetical protein